MDKAALRQLVLNIVRQLLEEEGHTVTVTPDTPLYGRHGVLNSLMLMRLVVEVEAAVGRQTGRMITLTSPQAFSARRSPFASVAALADFIEAHFNAGADA